MVFICYVCEDFTFSPKTGVLTVYEIFGEFKTSSKRAAMEFIREGTFTAAVCPVLYKDENGVTVEEVIIK